MSRSVLTILLMTVISASVLTGGEQWAIYLAVDYEGKLKTEVASESDLATLRRTLAEARQEILDEATQFLPEGESMKTPPLPPLVCVFGLFADEATAKKNLKDRTAKGRKLLGTDVSWYQSQTRKTRKEVSKLRKKNKKRKKKAGGEEGSLIKNGFFNVGLANWKIKTGANLVRVVPEGQDGSKCLLYDHQATGVYSVLTAEGIVPEGARTLVTQYSVKCENVKSGKEGWMVLMVKMFYYDLARKQIVENSAGSARGTHPWKSVRKLLPVPPGAKTFKLVLEFHLPTGKIWVDDVKVTATGG